MASIFKRTRLRPIPDQAEIGRNGRGRGFARWRDGRGRLRRAPLNDSNDRIVVEDANYTISFFDHIGQRRTVAGTTDKLATERIAAKIESDVEMRRRGVIDAAKESIGKQANAPIESHVGAFENMLIAKGISSKHIETVLRHVKDVIQECDVATPLSIEATRIEAYVKRQRERGLSARTVNSRLISVKQFTGWLWRNHRLASDPLAGMKVDRKREEKDRRLVRRTLPDQEFSRLIAAAKKGPEWTWPNGGADEPKRLSISGADRTVVYWVASGTGLRVSELAQLQPSAFDLDSDPPTVTARAAYAKGGREDTLPISRELARVLRPWLAGRPAGRPVFTLPPNVRTAAMLRFDLEAAAIPATDAEGRVFDFHALRGQYITGLGKSGASQIVVQDLARHVDFKTTRRYLDITLADSAAAVNNLPVPGRSDTLAVDARATGTEGAEIGQQFGYHSQTTSSPAMPQHVSMQAHGDGGSAEAQLFADSTVSHNMSQDVNGPAGIRTRTALAGQRILSPLRLPIPPRGRGRCLPS